MGISVSAAASAPQMLRVRRRLIEGCPFSGSPDVSSSLPGRHRLFLWLDRCAEGDVVGVGHVLERFLRRFGTRAAGDGLAVEGFRFEDVFGRASVLAEAAETLVTHVVVDD